MKFDVRKTAPFALFALFVFLFPLFGGKYGTFLMARIGILSLYAVAFNVLFGYGGLLSFGHALFFSGAAYGLGIALLVLDWPLWTGLLIGLLVTFLFALVAGFLSLRHKEIHFAMVTLALSMLFWGIVMKWRHVTGGEDGLAGISRGMSVRAFYYLSWTVIFVSMAVVYRILSSDFGLLLRGVRENDLRVLFSGHSVRRVRMIAFVFSALFTGVAGILWTLLDGAVTPAVSHWSFSAVPVIATLIGGPQSFAGPIVGTFVYVLAEDYITKYTMYWQIFLGLVILAIVLFFRGGIVGIVYDRILSRFVSGGEE
ncbi:MAG: branched-chain amino acid ABC transporter permease [Deltaproteobacteria bacterium]|nr:MAG: branched-chain amino acid ABC transporter permease [Deltaproteobacteria bacterium]